MTGLGTICGDEIGNLWSLVVGIYWHSETEFYVSKLVYLSWLYLTPQTNLKTFRKEDLNIIKRKLETSPNQC